jgi:hypothetical protein
MNFCIKEKAFLKAGEYDENLGLRENRPEMARWHRLGAEESDLAIRVRLWTGLKVAYDPNLIVEHRLRPESILLGGLVRRALHVGHNRAYIHSKYPRSGVVNDNQTFERLVKELTFTAKKFLRNPVRVWQSFSFTFLVVIAFGAGFLEGLLHYRRLSLAVNKYRTCAVGF